MNHPFAIFSFVVLVLSAVPSITFAQENKTFDKRIAKVERQVSSMEKVLKLLIGEVEKARAEKDINRLNCLLVKRDLAKGLLKATDKAKAVVQDAIKKADSRIADVYGAKVASYNKSVQEIQESLAECLGTDSQDDGTTLVFVKRDTEDMGSDDKSSPWDSEDAINGVDGYPAVPPASPFR